LRCVLKTSQISDLALQWVDVTEAAALAAYQWVGAGQKNAADQAAVEAMRASMNRLPIAGTIVIGEGEIDEAPMLYIGENVGQGGVAVDIAVDPVEGTRMTAMGQANAISVLAVAEAGSLLAAPDMYMEKWVVGPAARGVIDIERPLSDNLSALARALAKPVSDLTAAVLSKPRHQALIAQLRSLGLRVHEIPDGDVAASLLVCAPNSEIDFMTGVGGAPEGVISAAAMRALGGDMQARLIAMTQAKGDTPEHRLCAEREQQQCQQMGVEIGAPLTLSRLAHSDQVLLVATGITGGELLRGVRRNHGRWVTESVLITRSGQRYIQTEHATT
jgi:fructose-1,6-bisphosphatase II